MFLSLYSAVSVAQVNYDEDHVPDYELPALFDNSVGMTPTRSAWEEKRRSEVFDLLSRTVYGSSLPDWDVQFHLSEEDKSALGGKAIRKNVVITVSNQDNKVDIELLIYLPKDRKGPSPLFIGMNFFGNHTIHSDPSIPITTSWVNNNERFQIANNRANEESRAVRSHRWPVETILQRGYGLATIYYGDVDPDFDDGFQNGIHRLMVDDDINREGLSSISAWAYGLSLAMDYFESDQDISHGKIALMGHSRLGKAALWAGASDERFAVVISNNSGCGGAALSRRRFGETVRHINERFPHWFTSHFREFNDREDELPVDQHMLLSMMAPRPLYVASAKEDQWADPTGEYLALCNVSSVYELYNAGRLDPSVMPETGRPVIDQHLGYHIRDGKHDVTLWDWERYMDFADRFLMTKSH